jgi:hypothetical protein
MGIPYSLDYFQIYPNVTIIHCCLDLLSIHKTDLKNNNDHVK